MLKQAAQSPDLSRSVLKATQEAVALHGKRLVTKGLPTTILQSAVVYGVLTAMSHLSEEIFPDSNSPAPTLRS